MMNTSQPQLNNLPDSDLELLSAYLDNQLTVSERVRLERRLGVETRLRAELEELRATALLLRDLEPVRPPRSFTLDPATAPRRARVLPLAWVMQFGSGLAGLMLVLLASAQILLAPQPSAVFAPINSGLSSAGAPAAEMSQAQPAATSAPAAMEAPAATMGFAATEAPAVESVPMPAPTEAAAADAAANSTAPKDPAADQAASVPTNGPYGGGSAGGAGLPPAQATIDTMQQRTAADDDTQSLPASAIEPEQAAPGVPPGLTLLIGVVLLALAAGSYLYSRRRV